jgi:hypothetical protein
LLKAVLAVVAGYLTMAIAVAALTLGLFVLLGPDRAYQPGTYEVSTVWVIACFAASFVSAVLGGFVCSRISGQGALKALAALVVALGVLFAFPLLDPANDPRPLVRPPGTSSLMDVTNSRQPVWAAMSFPVVGAIGVLIGGRGKR